MFSAGAARGEWAVIGFGANPTNHGLYDAIRERTFQPERQCESERESLIAPHHGRSDTNRMPKDRMVRRARQRIEQAIRERTLMRLDKRADIRIDLGNEIFHAEASKVLKAGHRLR